MTYEKRLVDLIRTWKLDIVKFVRDVWGVEPTSQQVAVLNDLSIKGAKVSVSSAHGTGKTTSMAWAAIWHTFLFRDSRVLATAPSSHQLKDVLMSEVATWVGRSNPWIKDALQVTAMGLCVKGAEKTQFMTAKTADETDPSSLQGLHAPNMMVLVDEAFGVHENVFNVLKGTMTTDNCRTLMCGNPTTNAGYAYHSVFGKTKDLWKGHILSGIDSPIVTPKYIEEMKLEHGEDSDEYRIRVLGLPPIMGFQSLIGFDIINRAVERVVNQADYRYAPRLLGVDPAWEGNDHSVLYERQGLYSKMIARLKGINNVDLSGIIMERHSLMKYDAIFIDTGWGAGIIDVLRSMGCEVVIPVHFNSVSLRRDCANKKAQMWLDMKDWLTSGGSIEDIDMLKLELGNVQKEYNHKDGTMQMEKKRKTKERLGSSPDMAEALAMTFAFPVEKKVAYYQNSGKLVTEYDLLD